jgi:Mrp family chromosome partitioning ATPase
VFPSASSGFPKVARTAEALGCFPRSESVDRELREEKDFRAYLRPILSRWWLILAVVPVVTIGTYLYYDHKPKQYSSSAELYVQPSALDKLLLQGSGGTNQVDVENLALLIQTKAVGAEARRQLRKLGVAPQGAISATPVESSSFIVVTGTAATPAAAATLANAYARSFVEIQAREAKGEANATVRTAERQLRKLGGGTGEDIQREGLETKIQTLKLVATQPGSAGVRLVEPATPAAVPLNHDPKQNAIFAFVISLLLTVGAAYGLEYLTRKITSVETVEEVYEVPVLTEVPKVDTPTPSAGADLVMDRELHEPFHRLQMNLDMLANERPMRKILIASAAPGEGKSIVTRNLALAYREANRNVAVLDADFRKATLGGLLQAREGPGLTDILSGRASFGQAVQEIAMSTPSENGNGAHPGVASTQADPALGADTMERGELAMVPAGAHRGDLAATLASGAVGQTLSTAAEIYDRVLIDSSPLLAAADVLPLLSEVDGVLLVTRLGVTTRDSARRLLSELRRIPNVHIVGVVVNGIPPRIYKSRAYGYYYG